MSYISRHSQKSEDPSNNGQRASKLPKRRAIEELSKEELELEIAKMKNQIQKMKLQNNFFEVYLKKIDPKSLEGMENFIENMEKQYQLNLGSNASVMTSSFASYTSLTSQIRRDTKYSQSSPKTIVSKVTVFSGLNYESGVEINKIYMIELIEHEIEDRRSALQAFKDEYYASKSSLQAESECSKMHLAEIMESRRQLDMFVAGHTDPSTGKIPADKYIKHIEQGLKKMDQEMRKMKLKTTALRREYRCLKSQQQQKLEMMERLHPIDIEKLKIENKELSEVYEEKTKVLYVTKHLTGRIGQNIIVAKNKLNEQSAVLKSLNQEARKKEVKLKKLQDENEQANNVLVSVEKENFAVKNLVQTYKAPEVLEYVKKKVEVTELNNAVKICERQCKNQQLTQCLLTRKQRQMVDEGGKPTRSHLFTPINKHAGTIGSSTVEVSSFSCEQDNIDKN